MCIIKKKRYYTIRIFILILLFSHKTVLFTQDYSKFRPQAINGYYFKNIVPFSEPSQVGFGVVIPAYINNDSLIDFYSTKTKYPQNANAGFTGYEVSTFEIFINQGNFVFKKDTRQYVRDSIFIIRDDGINAIADFNGDGVNDLVFTGEPFHNNPQSVYFNIGIRNKIDVDSSKNIYARRPNILISNNGKLIDSIGFLDSLVLKSYFGSLTFDWNNDGKSDLILSERGDGKTFQFWENKGAKMSLSYSILERDTLQVSEGPFNLAAYDLNKDGFKDFIFSSQVEPNISQNGNVFVCFNDNGKFNNNSVINIINHRILPIEKNGLRASDIQVNDLDNDGNPEIVALFSNGSGDHSAIDNNKVKSIFKIVTFKDGNFTDVTKSYFINQENENLFYSNRLFKLIDIDNDGLIDLYPITGDNGCTSKSPKGCGYFGYQGIDSTVYFKNKKGSFELKTLGLFFSDTASQNIYHEFKNRKINIGGYNLALGNQIVPYFIKGVQKPVFVAGIQKQSVEMYEGEIYNDSLKNIRTRLLQNSFLNYNFRSGFVLVPCENQKPIFNATNYSYCSADSLRLSISNMNKGDTIKWYFNNKLDSVYSPNKVITSDSMKVFVIRTDSLGCVISSDTIQTIKNITPQKPTVSTSISYCQNTSASPLSASAAIGSTLLWYGTDSTGGTGGSTSVTPLTSKAGTTDYYVSQKVTSTGCESPRSKISVKVNPTPDKPSFNTSKYSFCTGDSLKLSITNVNKGDTLKWYFGTKSDLTNVANKTFTDSTKVYVTRTDSIGCIISSDTIQLKKYAIPSSPSLSRDADNNLVSNSTGNIWYKDGVKIADTTQKIKPTSNGIYTATTTQNGCTSALSQGYYYITNAVPNLSNGEYFRISPNPTSGELNINYRFSSGKDVYISVIDMNGRNLILNRKINSGSKINIGSFSKGNYIIQVNDKTGRLITSQKVVKE